MKILMVSPFPPLRDGVGKYAAQEVRALRDEGHEVEVLAPIACAANHVENFKTWSGGLAKLRGYARRYDRVILQYQPAHFHWRSEGPARIASNFWMMVAFRTIRNLEVVCHEIEYPAPAWSKWRPEVFFDRMAWAGARHVEFHTTHEIEQMRERLDVTPKQAVIRDHGRYFRPAVAEDRATARRRLKEPDGTKLLLCIGFIQAHKGFDRAIRAFRRVRGDARLVVVGSVRTGELAHRGYLDELRYLAAADDRVSVIERSLSDDEFDRWIIASDAVVLPYREIWSSGVLERARVLGRPVIASAAGGLAEQLHAGDTLVANDEELAIAMGSVVGTDAVAAPPPLTVPEAMAYVSAEARRRGFRERRSELDRALYDLSASRGVHLITLPSRRRYVGGVLDIAKRMMRRGLGWLMMPLLGQINHFQDLTVEAMEELAAAQRRSLATAGLVRFPEDALALRDRVRAYLAEIGHDGPVVHITDAPSGICGVMREEGVEASEILGDAVLGLSSFTPGELSGVVVSVADGTGLEVASEVARVVAEEIVLATRRALRPGGALLVEAPADQPGPAVLELFHEALGAAGFVGVERRTVSRNPRRTPIDGGADAPEWAQQLAKMLDAELEALSERLSPAHIDLLVARLPG